MLSALLSTSGFHYSRWQSGGICHVLSTNVSRKIFSISSALLWYSLGHAFVCSLSLVFLAWHCVSSLLSVAANGILDALEAGNCARSSACVFFTVFSIGLCTWWHVSGVFWQLSRKVSLHTILKFEGLASIVKFVFHFLSFITSCTHFRSHLGALSVPSRIGGERIIRASLTLIRCVVFVLCTYVIIFKPLLHLVSPWPFLSLLLSSYAKLGMSMETVLDPGWRVVQKGLSLRSGSSSAVTLLTDDDHF